MIMVTKWRNNKGSITALTTALAMLLVVLGVGFFFFTMYMGAQKETKNAVDAGTLNVGRQALDKVSVKIPPTSTFYDITSDKTNNNPLPPDCDGEINLRRVNRMWAKAMLYKINALGADVDNTVGTGYTSASSARSQCESVSNQLAGKLKDQTNLHGFFTDIANRNSVRMIGQSADVSVIPGGGWQTSTMQETDESNVVLGGDGGNFFPPPNFSWNSANLTATKRNQPPPGSTGITFLKGYHPINLGGDSYWQVPFRYDEKPHMVARSNFDPDKSGPGGWSNPVPNAFSAEGVASQPGRPAEKATSWVLTNPRQTFRASLPTAFVHIRIETPELEYYFLPKIGGPPIPGIGTPTTYGFKFDFPSVTGYSPAGGVACISTTINPQIALDTSGKTVDKLLFSYPSSSNADLERYLTSRCNQMISKPGVFINPQKMHEALDYMPNILKLASSNGPHDFYVYSPDGENIHCRILAQAITEAPWLAAVAGQQPDGSEKSYNSSTGVGPPIFGSAIPVPTFKVIEPLTPFIPCGWTKYKVKNYWQSGTGYNHCLGQVRCEYSTSITTISIAVFTLI